MSDYMKDYIVNPIKVRTKVSEKASIYECIVAMGQRACQINDDIKMQIMARMAHINPVDEETDYCNYDQLAISKEFDVIPKPTFLAMKEMDTGKLNYEVTYDKKSRFFMAKK